VSRGSTETKAVNLTVKDMQAQSPGSTGPPHEHTEDELRRFKAPVLVELVMETREQRNEL
jgi:hypothetical protein